MTTSRVYVATAMFFAGTCLLAQEGFTARENEMHAMCAAANALLATKMDKGMFADAVDREAKRHANAARKLGVTDADLQKTIETMALAYNQEKITWNQIADLGEMCTRI